MTVISTQLGNEHTGEKLHYFNKERALQIRTYYGVLLCNDLNNIPLFSAVVLLQTRMPQPPQTARERPREKGKGNQERSEFSTYDGVTNPIFV